MAGTAIIDSYTALKNALEDHANRSDIDDEGVSAMAIDLAEARFNRIVTHPARITRDDSFTVDSQYETVPTDFWRVMRFSLNTSPSQALEYLSPEEMAQKRQTLGASGRPIYYSVIGGNFEFLPTPGSSYTGLLVYQAAIPALASNATNWLLDDHPDIYLYAALAEVHSWAQDEEQAMIWDARLQRALKEIEVQGSREQHGGTPVARAKPFGRAYTRGL